VTTTEGPTTRELRRAVLRAHLGSDAPLPGDDRAGVVHVAAFDDDDPDHPVGACLVFAEPCDWRPEQPAWILRSMAVDPRHRGRGVGRAVLGAAEQVARDRGAVLLWCHARESAAGFWHAAGWRDRHPDGDARQTFVEPETGILHRDMYRSLTRNA
jgi:GNAT superfamily N-acetyltransferase